ncbi:MAG: hypothetical protein ACRC26_02270 [Bacteroidales bacterium]
MGKTVNKMKTVNVNTKLNFSLEESHIEDAAITRETLLIKELDLRIRALNNGRQGRVTLTIGERIIETDIDTYNDDNRLSWLIKTEYLGYEIPKEDLGFGKKGNGVTVWDRFREKYNDYLSVAHISTDGKIEYYEEISEEGKARIEAFAKNL